MAAPSAKTPAIQARIINASITAYSTAVVASSSLKKEPILFSFEIMSSLLEFVGLGG